MSDRHEMQAAGTHPAPCARHCESTAYEIEIRRLRHDIERHVGIATEVTQELEQLRANFAALQHAIVGDTGASAILTAERLRAELAASRHELVGAKKAARAQARIIESLQQQQRAHLHAQRDQWIEARNTLDSERAANARLAEELAACCERESRMRDTLIVVRHHPAFDDGGPMAEMMDQVIGNQPSPLLEKIAEFAALAEGAQG